MKDKICKYCTYYRQHYILDKDCCRSVYCGHCTHGRPKNRKPDQAACEYYAFVDDSGKLPDREEVIHFLTTEFLQRVLEKPLPPEIVEDGGRG